MYSRYPNYRFAGGIKVPENYSGNAFDKSKESTVPLQSEEATESIENTATNDTAVASSDPESGVSYTEEDSVNVAGLNDKKFKLPSFNFGFGKLFSHGFGFEELLIIGLILLISQSDTDDDIILLLILLLFIK